MSVRGTRVPEHLRLPIAGVTPPPTEKDGQRLFPTGNFRFFRPVYRDKMPPCNNACPTGEQIQKYLDFVKHERYLDGYLTILEDNPMPSVTGRVCYHPCETACNRAAHDEPIGIRNVERFLGDFGLALEENPVKASLPPLNGKTVAIVGSGPAGLACAYHLRRLGYSSVIFEALEKPGGMLRAGIPHWHLPEEILDAELAKLLDLGGIEIRCGVRVGAGNGHGPENPGWDDLRNYDATFLALGQDVGRRLSVEGAQARGVTGAMEFLRETGLGRPLQVGRQVLVIGGGNTASDAARSAIRLGGGEATIVSLEAESELLIVPEDLVQARDEGVALRPGTACVRILSDNDHVTGAVLCQARLAKDESGAVRPELIPGTEYEVPCDTVFVAIGQVQQLAWLPDHLIDRGLITADEHGRIEGNVFVGGDVMRGPSMVVDALGDGKRAARDLDRLLSAQPRTPEDPVEVMPYEKLNSAYFRHAARIEAPLSPAAARRRSQRVEVTLAYSREEAVAESDRCMSCGVCNGCDNCYIVCPDVSVMRDTRENGHYAIRTTYCKGCLVCVQECPTGCLEKVPEMDFDEPEAVTRMETAFAPYDGAHAEQSAFTQQLIEETIAEYDAARAHPKNGHKSTMPNGSGVTA
jgi:NADPH-dependent glutamate synthase beta subunit-like oxidoreductase